MTWAAETVARPPAPPRPPAARGDAPWAGYDDASAASIVSALQRHDGDPDRVLAYERAHRDRKTVTAAVTRASREQRGPGA